MANQRTCSLAHLSSAPSRQSGFTLVECLIILAIAAVMIMIVLPLYGNTAANAEIERFFDQFEEDFLYAQQLAIAESRRVEIRFFTNVPQYLIRYYAGKNIVLRPLPQGMTLETNLVNNTLMLNRRGHVSQGGKVFFYYEQGNKRHRKTFTFQIASGRIQGSP